MALQGIRARPWVIGANGSWLRFAFLGFESSAAPLLPLHVLELRACSKRILFFIKRIVR